MVNLAKLLIVFGIVLIFTGGVFFLISRLGIPISKLPLGKLPGDFNIVTKNMTCIFPLATSIILSLFLTLVINLFLRFLNK